MNRIQRLRDRMLRAEHARHRIFMPREWSTREIGGSLPERKACAFGLLLDRMPIFIEEGEWIVGGRTVFGRRNPSRDSLADPSRDISTAAFPSYATPEEIATLGSTEGASLGHFVPNYPKVMKLGFGGIADQARARLESETTPSRRDFLAGVRITFEAAGRLALRYAGLAESMAATTAGPRRHELSEIASVCRHVAARPPETLHQALQLLWFTHLAGMIENYALMSFGRMDQYLLPFYRACDKARAMTLLQCLLIKFNDQGDINLDQIAYDGMDNMVLGGAGADGRDVTNELTYALFDALDSIRLPNPEVAVRIHKGSPGDYVRRACELVTSGMGQIAFFNDDTFIPALVGAGFPPHDARNYVLDACQDILIEGKSVFYTGGGWLCLTDLLLRTVNEAHDDMTFEEFTADYRRRIAQDVKETVERINGAIRSRRDNGKCPLSPLLFLSGTLDDCVEKGLDYKQGGLHYLDQGFMVSGAPVTAINGLAALRRVVFDRREARLSEVRQALEANFEGREPLRRKLAAAPKWGNDDDYVDAPGREIVEFACREVLKYRTADGARFLSGIHQPHSYGVGLSMPATPDGRKAGEPVPVTLSPANGTDRRGPTAVMKSVAKIDPMLSQWNSALGMTFHPSSVRSGEGLTKFTDLLRTFFRIGGAQLQLNVVSADTLRAAQKEPEKYPDLVVRVWGFSGRFVCLCKGYQDDVIARTEHAV